MNKIIFGGGFDPIHKGHINMALIASKAFNADVIFVPAVISVWKDSSAASFLDRKNMIEIIIKEHDYSRFSVSTYENETGEEINYSYKTIRYFKELYPKDKLFLLIGEDQVLSFDKWKKADEISENAQIIFLKRKDEEVISDNIEKYHMIALKGDNIDVSSSEIRNMEKLNMLDISSIYYIGDSCLYYAEKLKKFLYEEGYRRYYHSLSVAHLAYEIALSNKIDNPERAYIAALLHDSAKCIDKEELKTLMETNFKEFMDIPAWSYHQFVGSIVAKREFGIQDEEILEAIMFHATGKKDMSVLGKIVYAADKIDPSRGYDSTEYVKACLKDYEKGFRIVLQANKDYLIEKGKDYTNRLTMECFDEYLK